MDRDRKESETAWKTVGTSRPRELWCENCSPSKWPSGRTAASSGQSRVGRKWEQEGITPRGHHAFGFEEEALPDTEED